jgi:hypothetical protein
MYAIISNQTRKLNTHTDIEASYVSIKTSGKGIGQVHPRTGHEGPERE